MNQNIKSAAFALLGIYAVALVGFKIFKSDEGQKALTYLKNLAYEKKPIALQNDGINTTIVMAMQEGEINFFRKIEKILTKIENYDRRK